VGGFGIACVAIEALTKQLAAELGPRDIRAVCLRLKGIPESWEGVSTEGWSAPTEEIEAAIKARSLLGRVTTPGRRRERGGLHGFGSGRRDDGERRQPDLRHGY
jgi:NAD(P)-dependent dehydrogenase (short-subunit alcohol dehydrogenase family)